MVLRPAAAFRAVQSPLPPPVAVYTLATRTRLEFSKFREQTTRKKAGTNTPCRHYNPGAAYSEVLVLATACHVSCKA